MFYLKLHVTGLSLPRQFSGVVLAADPLSLAVLYGALQVPPARGVPQTEEPGGGAGAGHHHPPPRPHHHRHRLVVHLDGGDSLAPPAQQQHGGDQHQPQLHLSA